MKKIFFWALPIIALLGFGYHKSTVDQFINKSEPFEYKGVNLSAPKNEITNQTFLDLKNSNANAVSLIPYAFVAIEKASVTYHNNKQWWGESTLGIKACIKMAKEQQMKLMIKPHLWVNHQFYTGNLDFKTNQEWEKWETDYQKYILEFAQIAQDENVALFCLGTELGNAIAKRPDYWLQLILKIKTIYKGKLTYAANWDDFDKVPFWNQLDYIGIDAYFPISENENPTVNELKKGWKKHLEKIETLEKKWHKKILFTEFGYRNSNFVGKEPWAENNAEINNEAQANAYQAFFETFKNKKWFAGCFVWKWYADEQYKRKKIDYTPQQKPALEIIKQGYR